MPSPCRASPPQSPSPGTSASLLPTPQSPALPSRPHAAPRLMTRGSGGEPTLEVSPDNRFLGAVGGKRPWGPGALSPPSSPIPSTDVISSPAFRATCPTGDKDGMVGGGWAPRPPGGERQLPSHRGGGRLGEDGEGGKSREERIIHGHSLSPFHCI